MKQLAMTGGNGGLGTAIASAFRNAGWDVLTPRGTELDMRRPEAVRAYFVGHHPDLLICAAGVTRDSLLARMPEKDWDEVMQVNFHSAAACAEAVIPGMISRGGGHVVFISSYAAHHPPAGQAAYATSKAALLGLTQDLAQRHGGKNIRVNVILPGFLKTQMTEKLTEDRVQDFRNAHTLSRFNTPQAVADFIRFLHENLPHTSGQVFQLDSRTG
jgi:3-oxoacyl-[acyl-carrier protein] reductase